MILAVGLGNPGKKYETTRHNVGFMTMDELVRKNGFPEFKFVKKFNAVISGGFINNQKIVVAKPQTFMNNSGRTVKKLIKNYKLKIENLFVVHDDLVIPLGRIKISKGRKSAGHKGIESVIRELSTKDFVRFRVGTGLPLKKNLKTLVLKQFSKKEMSAMQSAILTTAQAIHCALEDGVAKAMTLYNKRVNGHYHQP